jgi:malate dehydrogenase
MAEAADSKGKEAVRVVLTGAAGQIGYSMLPLICTGQVFGPDQPIVLALLEITPALKALHGVALELEDGAYPLIEEIVQTDDAAVAFKGADYAILVGGFPRKKGMERKDLLARNGTIFKAMGQALESHAKDSCKVLVVANPANTNCLVCATNVPKIPKTNFSALTRLDYNRATAQVALKAGLKVAEVKNVIIWGNHSATQVPDVTAAIDSKTGKSIELDNEWVRGDFTKRVQSRGKEIIEARGFSSAMSAANATKDAFRDWVLGTEGDYHVAMAVWSDGNSYGVADGLYYSFPVRCRDGKYSIVDGVAVDDTVKELMKKSEAELIEERSEALADSDKKE